MSAEEDKPSRGMTFSHKVDGFQLPTVVSEKDFRAARSYRPKDDDVFIVGYPKSGTTWIQHIVMPVRTRGKPIATMEQFSTATPYLEALGPQLANLSPVAIKSHLPYELIPWSSKAKYIYIARNPKDTCVSFFYHMRNLPMHGFKGTFDDFFELFIEGDIDYGDYFDNLLSWYKHRTDPNVLFLTYEQLKEDTTKMTLKIASFIDDTIPVGSDQQLLKDVLQYSSLEYMQDVFNKSMDQLFRSSVQELMSSDLPQHIKQRFADFQGQAADDKSTNFIRKGIIGDWRNHLTEDQSRRLDEKLAERTKGTDIAGLWKKYM